MFNGCRFREQKYCVRGLRHSGILKTAGCMLVVLLGSLVFGKQAQSQTFLDWQANAPVGNGVHCESADATTVARCYLGAYNFHPDVLYPRDVPNCGIAPPGGAACVYWFSCGTGTDCAGNAGTFQVTALVVPAQFYVSTESLAVTDCGCDKNNNNKPGDPINPANGNVSHEEVDIPAQSASPLSAFVRYYNSVDPSLYNPAIPTNTDLAVGWRHSFSRTIIANVYFTPYQPYVSGNARNSLIFTTQADACVSGWAAISAQSAQWPNTTASYNNTTNICSLSQGGTVVATIPVRTGLPVLPSTGTYVTYDAIRDDGQDINFTVQGSSLVPQPGSTLRLTLTANGYKLIDDDDNVEIYNSSGQLLTLTSRAGVVETMAYDASNRLSTVTDSFGRQLVLNYNTRNQLTSVTDPT